MTRYLLVHHGHEEQLLPESPIPTEEKLHDAFEKYPQLFPAEELNLGQLMVVGREVGFESGAADLICVDEGGQIVVVEVKKGTENPDSRRVVAQMLDYGAQLWGYSFEEFESRIAMPYLRKRFGSTAPTNLLEAAARQFGFEDTKQGVDAFAEGLARNLEAGSFTYAVVARTLPPTLTTVLRYLGEISRVHTAAIAVDFYREGDRHTLAPRVVFSSATAQRPKMPTPSTSKTTIDQFLLDVGPGAASYWSSLIEFLQGLPGKLHWGSKGFSYKMVLDGKQHSVLRVYPRTAWWLLGKGKGDLLQIITKPTPDKPELFRRVVETTTNRLTDCKEAEPTVEGEETLVTFYVRDQLPESTDQIVRRVLTGLFSEQSGAC